MLCMLFGRGAGNQNDVYVVVGEIETTQVLVDEILECLSSVTQARQYLIMLK